jgi:hypothetical protein
MICSSLIIGSVITIANATSVLTPYNLTHDSAKSSEYTEFTIYLVLASLGVILGLWGLMSPQRFESMPYLLPILTFIWLAVTFLSIARASVYYEKKVTSSPAPANKFNNGGYIFQYIITGLLLASTIRYTFW